MFECAKCGHKGWIEDTGKCPHCDSTDYHAMEETPEPEPITEPVLTPSDEEE